MSGSLSFDNISSLSLMRTSESFSDLNAELAGNGGSTRQRSSHRTPTLQGQATNGTNGAVASGSEDSKPFGLGKENHLYFRLDNFYFPFQFVILFIHENDEIFTIC
jgi:hypothetical protein